LTASGFGLTAWAGGGGSDDGATDPGPTKSVAEAPGEAGEEAREEDGGVHRGPIDRFHVAGSCDLVSIGGLPGHWAHGDYVTAVADLGDTAVVVDAAHSDCGKPMQAVGHGLGPPANALEHGSENGEGGEEAAGS
jgi:hypothetical protein